MCSVVSALSDFRPCRTRHWQLSQFDSSQKSQDPKYSLPNLKKSKLQWQVPHSWWRSASTVTKGVVKEPATGNKRVTAYWQVWLERTKGVTAFGHEAGLPLVISSFSESHDHILRPFLAHMVNDTKWTRYAAGSALIEDVCSGWWVITCLAFESLQVVLYTSYKALGKCLFCGQQCFC